MKILFYLLTPCPWLLNHLLNCFLQPLALFLFIGTLLLLNSTWFYSNLRGKFKFSEKAKTSLKYPFFKAGVVNHCNHGQTFASKPELFHFDTLKYKKYFDELSRI